MEEMERDVREGWGDEIEFWLEERVEGGVCCGALDDERLE